MATKRRQFHAQDWSDLVERNPWGLHSKIASMSAVRYVVTVLQRELTSFGFLIALDETDVVDDPPHGVIVCDGLRTFGFRLSFRPKLVSVAGNDVYVAHAGGAQMLAEAITAEVKKALGFKNRTSTRRVRA